MKNSLQTFVIRLFTLVGSPYRYETNTWRLYTEKPLSAAMNRSGFE